MVKGKGASVEVPFDRQAPWNGAGAPKLEHLVAPGSRRSRVTRSLSSPDRAVHALAAELRESAIVADGVATWLRSDATTGREVTTGAGVYAGGAGALLVLAHAHRLDGDRRHVSLLRATARGMLVRQSELPPNGFHSGQPGTAAALAEAAVVSGDDEMRAIAESSLAQAGRADARVQEWDVVSGVAGTILGLYAAATLLEVPLSIDHDHLGDQLASRHETDPTTGGARWRSRIGGRRPALAGLAHGASGAALALAVASGGGRVVPQLVERATAFEDGPRVSELGWIDHRIPDALREAVGWCHGAGGIGIASAALATRYPGWFLERTRLAAGRLRDSLATFVPDASLCHGVSGRALALAVLAKAAGAPEDMDLASEVFERLPEDDMPRDVSLMTGEPGVVLAQIAVAQLAPAPIAFVLDPVLFSGSLP